MYSSHTARTFRTVLAAVLLTLLAACKPAADATADKAAPPPLTAPATADDGAWKLYLGDVVGRNMEGVTDRVFPYYLPASSETPDEGGDGTSMYQRQLEQVNGVVQRTVLPGNMLAFGSPDSAKMGDMIVEAFKDPPADALKGSKVLFIGKAADNGRVKAAVEASGANYVFIEAK